MSWLLKRTAGLFNDKKPGCLVFLKIAISNIIRPLFYLICNTRYFYLQVDWLAA